MTGRIFINYRRDDSIGTAGRLRDRLVAEFGRQALFMDVDNIPAGVDFVSYLDGQVEVCEVFLAIIGPGWLDAIDGKGRRRLDDPDDFVSIEIASALRRGIRVMPVLIDGARLPNVNDLPNPLKPLVRRQATELRNFQFGRDAAALVQQIRATLESGRQKRRWVVPAVGVGLLFVLGVISTYWLGLSMPFAGMTGHTRGAQNIPVKRTDARPSPDDLLRARMIAFSVPPTERENQILNYDAEATHKAIALSIQDHRTYRSTNWATAAEAEIAALEGCQIAYGRPCAVMATDSQLQPAEPPIIRDMPRPHYNGLYDLQEIPKARPETLQRLDVAHYATATEAKAVAYHPDETTLVVVSGASSQFEAEAEALARCNEIRRNATGGGCLLYAVGNQVVLPLRLRAPLNKSEKP